MARPWYKRYPGDFIAGTVLLNFEQKGAYSMLLDLMYLRGGPVPDVPQEISRIMGLSVRKWKSIRQNLLDLEKIYELNGHLHNRRVDRELPENEKEGDKLRENGVKGGEKSGESRSKIDNKNAENEADYSKNNNLDEKGLQEKGKHTRASQMPETRVQKEGSITTTTESTAARGARKPPDGGGGFVGGFVDDPFAIPEFLDRRKHPEPGDHGPGADPGTNPDLRGRPRLEDQFDATQPIPESPGKPVADAYMAVVGEVYGTAHHLLHAGHGASSIAKRWLEAGADVDLCREVFQTVLTTMHAKGDQPPTTLKYFENPIARAIKEAKAPMPTAEEAGARGSAQDIHPDSERNQWISRINGWRERGLWLDIWGPNPDEPGCAAPRDLLRTDEAKDAAQ